MARTTIDLDPGVIRELKRLSKAEGKSMGTVASERLAAALGQADQPAPAPFRWVSRPLGRPMVNLEDREAVHAILDERP